MSNLYRITSDNLFDDVDDDTFLQGKSNNQRLNSTNPFAQDVDIERQKQLFEQKRREIEEKTLLSSNRSLGLLYETERVGTATAEELARQREQLENTSAQLDDINRNLRDSQKHLNGIKSIWGGLRNYLAGNQTRSDSQARNTPVPGTSKIVEESGTSNQNSKLSPDELYDSHPINRLRSDDQLPNNSVQTFKTASFSEQLDRNLDAMVGSLAKLKGLATDLGSEIETSNHLIDDIHDKVEQADIKINKQNRDMNRLLK